MTIIAAFEKRSNALFVKLNDTGSQIEFTVSVKNEFLPEMEESFSLPM